MFTISLSLRLIVELKWFLIELSVLPGRYLAISAHLLPNFTWAWIISSSSSSVHFSFFISGFRWLCHLSRHCFPILPGSYLAISDQFLAPWYFTISHRVWSSSAVQGPLISSGFSTFCHLWRHCTSILFWKYEAIFFQFLAYKFKKIAENNLPRTAWLNVSVYHPRIKLKFIWSYLLMSPIVLQG